MAIESDSQGIAPLPAALSSWNPLRWLTVFGPGAIIASLTIGTGELIFSSRGGAIFGYRILFLFLCISIAKWILVFTTARHMVLSGVHPLQRWMQLPGPAGWLPAVFLLFAVMCFPIWVSFHASVIGDLLAGMTGTKTMGNGAVIHLWGAAVLVLVLLLANWGGYQALEKVQLSIVTVMLLSVCVALYLFGPNWWQLVVSAVIPQSLNLPDWITSSTAPAFQEIAELGVWVEATLYVGVIGGGGYDYLAYTSYLRDKRWGAANFDSNHSNFELTGTSDPLVRRRLRSWLRAPLVDCSLSFLIVFIFSGVFVASGHLILGPAHQVPGDGGFLEHQAQFVTRIHPWLYPLYVAGTLMAMLGTLYGTLEVAPTILREAAVAFRWKNIAANQLRRISLAWCAVGAFLVLGVSFVYQLRTGNQKPAGLTALLIPANLFTGVMACGIICLLNPWMDRWLDREFRLPAWQSAANMLVGMGFLLLGLKGYWDAHGWISLLILFGTLTAGAILAVIVDRSRSD
ncbi:MAG: Nramp family divalent metal transporter [Planctomycetales bacterium]|nr:Nramp family divalent metal transporter [Planctomycetales bacterium]